MKVIDLLNKIANGEEVPKKIRYKNLSYIYSNECKGYYLGTNPERIETFDCNRLYQKFSSGDMLNDEIEVIEEDKKIEKIILDDWAEITYSEDWKLLTYDFNRNSNLFVDKINEIIDKINESEE